jgi:uncharacterized protein (DUF1501 family)
MLKVTRKEFLKYQTYLGLGALIGNISFAACSNETTYEKWQGKRLIIIRLDGGNDGLFSLAPVKNELLKERRPKLLQNLFRGPKWQNEWQIHPALSGLIDLEQRGEARLLPFTGYTKPNTSHFKSSEIWETGILLGENTGKVGWIGRWAEKHPESISIELPKTLNFDGIQRLFVQGHHCEAAAWGDQNLIDWFEEDISDWCYKYSNHPLA